MIKTKLSLDFMRKNITPRILAKELDSGRNVEITVYCDGVLVTDIFDETRVSTISKNGKPYFCSSIAEEPAISNLENGKSIWKIPSEVLEVPGITIGELRLLKKGDVISTMCFEILVEKTASKENATIPKSAVDFIIRAENAASKAEAAAMSIAQKHNSFVFDTEAHLLGWVGQNLCPMPEETSNAICELTHNDNGTFNMVVNSTGAIPLSFGTITLSEGAYVFTKYNCDFFFGLFGYTNPIEENTVFVVEKDALVQVGIYYQPNSGDNFKNAWIQITKGETVPDTFVAYHSPYERADGITKEILSKGDLLLTEENGKPAYWWDGTELKKLSATSNEGSIKIWQPNTEYKVGDVVIATWENEDKEETVIAKCNEVHTSSSSFTNDLVVYAVWDMKSINAYGDEYGRNIYNTYATKEELAEAIGEALEGDY